MLQMWGKRNTNSLLMQTGAAIMEISVGFKRPEIHVLHNSAMQILGMCLKVSTQHEVIHVIQVYSCFN